MCSCYPLHTFQVFFVGSSYDFSGRGSSSEYSGVEYSLLLYYLYAFHVFFVDHLYNFTYQGSSTCFHCVNVPGPEFVAFRFASLAIMLIHAWFQLKHARWFESQHLTMKDSNKRCKNQVVPFFRVMCFVMDASDASVNPFFLTYCRGLCNSIARTSVAKAAENK